MKHGIEIIYHASFVDEEALDCWRPNKDSIRGAGLAWLITLVQRRCHQVRPGQEKLAKMGYMRELEIAIEACQEDAPARHPRAPRR